MHLRVVVVVYRPILPDTSAICRDRHILSTMVSGGDDKENIPNRRLHSTPPPFPPTVDIGMNVMLYTLL